MRCLRALRALSLGRSKTLHRPAQEPLGRSKTLHKYAQEPLGRSKTLHRCAQPPLGRSKTLDRCAQESLGRSKTPHWPAQEPLGRKPHLGARKHCTSEHLKELFKKTVSASQGLCNTSLCSLCSENGYSQVHSSIYIYIYMYNIIYTCVQDVAGAAAFENCIQI